MQTLKPFLLILIFPFLSLIPPSEQASEIIRRKLENTNFKELSALGSSLYCSKALPEFYQKRAFEPAWDSKTSAALIESIEQSESEGLNPNDYHLQKLKEVHASPPKTELAKAENDMMLSDAFLLYASHLYSGKVNPLTIDAQWHVSRREGNPVELLQLAISSGNIKSSIQSAMPTHEVYKSLRKALKNLRNINAESWPIIHEGVTIKQGMEDERIPLIRERLFLLGDLKSKSSNAPNLYDNDLLGAIQHFQKRHGLDAEGDIGKKTMGALNVSIQKRIQQIAVNMERWRWLPQTFGNYYLKVNIANFELEVIKDGKPVRTHKVIAGKPARRTPVFSAQMQYLVFNPTWTVPPVILNGDVLPGIRKDPAYLDKKKMMVIDSKGQKVDPSTVDWNSKEVKGYTYRQVPGPDNALGAVKFMFPNSFHIYLHDTPAKELFSKTERAFSSGCIRVQEPLMLAEFLLNDANNWNLDKINKVIATQNTQTVQLKEKPNVHLLYWTAWTDSNGIIQFRNDIYERDTPLINQLLREPS